MAHMVI